MWPFKSSSSKTPPETPSGTTELRLDKVESELRMMRGEWEDTYERVMRALRRLNKRWQDMDKREESAQKTHEDAPQATIPGMPSLDPISAAIIARRNRAVPTGPNGGG